MYPRAAPLRQHGSRRRQAKLLQRQTLDHHHASTLAGIEIRRRRAEELREEVANLEAAARASHDTPCWERRVEVADALDAARRDLRLLEDHGFHTAYYSEAADVLVRYYSDQHASTPSGDAAAATSSNSPATLLSMLSRPGVGGGRARQPEREEGNDEAGSCDRARLLETYLERTCRDYVSEGASKEPQDTHRCPHCGSQRLQTDAHEGTRYCELCGTCSHVYLDSDNLVHGEVAADTQYFSYKRINHMKEWIAHVQGKPSTELPDALMESIMNELRKERFVDKRNVRPSKIREILKRLNVQKYEHVPYIVYRITGVPVMRFPPELETQIIEKFTEAQVPYLKHAPPDRKNFMSYPYFMHKICQMLGYSQYLPMLSLLKNRTKLQEQEQVWKAICQDLGWQFKPSI
jgi:hypothetical protein